MVAGVPKMSVLIDGTDCPVGEPRPLDPSFYSQKFKRAGVRYELAMCIATGNIVWANGSYKCGSYTDFAIFRKKLESRMESGGKILADSGYLDPPVLLQSGDLTSETSRLRGTIRARHESVNSRLKTSAF